MPSTVTPNPLVYAFPDFEDKAVTISLAWDPSTRATTGATLHRDEGCQWTKIAIGLGPDGSPDTSPDQFDLSGFVGDRKFSAGQLAARGLPTIDAFFALGQITAVR